MESQALVETLARWAAPLASVEVAIGLFWAIALFGVINLGLWWWVISRRKSRLKACLEDFEQKPPTVAEQRQWFAERFGSHGVDYANQLVSPQYPNEDEASAQSVNSANPVDTIMTGTDFLSHRGVWLEWYENLPNLLVGLGIFGTFLGLAAGILEAAPKLARGELEALTSLLNGASTAFLTSIAGLGASMVFSAVWKRSMARFDDCFAARVAQFDKVFPPINEVQYALDAVDKRVRTSLDGQREEFQKEFTSYLDPHVAEIRRLLDEAREHADTTQTQIKRFNDDLFASIGSVLDKALTESVGSKLAELIQSMEGMRKEQRESASSTATAAAQQLGEQMQTQMGGALAALQDSVTGASTAISDMQRTMAESHARIESSTANVASEVEQSLRRGSDTLGAMLAGATRELTQALATIQQQFALSQQRLDAAAANISTSVETSLQTGSENLSRHVAIAGEQLAATIRSVNDESNRSLASNSEWMRSQSEQTASVVRGALEHGAATLQQTLAEAIDKLSASIDEMSRTLVKRLDDASAQMEQRVNASSGALNQASDTQRAAIEHLSTQLRGASDEASARLRGASVQASETVRDATAKFADSVTSLGSALKQAERMGTEVSNAMGRSVEFAAAAQGANVSLQRTVAPLEQVARAVSETEQRIQAVAAGFAATLQTTQQQAKIIEEQHRKMQDTWEGIERRFSGVDESLSRAFDNYRSGVDEYSRQVAAYLQGFDQQHGKAINNLKAIADELSAAADAISGQPNRSAPPVRTGGRS